MQTPVNGLIVMGVAGSGKTTVGKALAARLGWDFFDADDFHPPANKKKMASGIPLDDADRAPWLERLQRLVADTLQAGRHPVLACSALKERYRRTLREGNDGVRIVYLKGAFALIHARLEARPGHYMKPGMLRSQFDALEEPPDALAVDVEQSVEDQVDFICRRLRLDAEA